MTSSSIMTSELNQHVKRLYKDFSEKAYEQGELSMRSRPSFSLFYQDQAEYYLRGARACEQYFETLNLLELVRELNNCGFLDEQLSLKNYTTDSEILNIIVMDW